VSRGFTLIEMLVAFVVLVTCLGALLPLLAGAARQSVVLQDYARAVTLAESLLAQAGEDGELRPGVQSGREGELEWTRRIEREEARAPDAQWIPWRVSVEVRWSAGKGSRAVALATLRVGARE
jgi:prepilin-type N-terminal cleavage/methylation domain-containing protein